jgi:hypothetical protein
MENNIVWIYTAIALILLTISIYWLLKWSRGKCVKQKWENGQVRSIHYINRKGGKNGVNTFYFRDGKINKKSTWIDNQLEGNSEVYYSTGEKYIISNYNKGRLEGDYNVYSKDGKIILHETYTDGELVTQNEHGQTYTEKFVSDIPNEPLILLFDNSATESFLREKRKYNIVKNEEETRDLDKAKTGFISGLKKIGKVVSGVDAYQSRESTKNLKEASYKLFKSAFKTTEAARKKLNIIISDFGSFRLTSLQNSMGRFLGLLKDMEQQNRLREYEILNGIGIDNKSIQEMKRIDMDTSKALKSSATVGVLGAAAAMGTPALVTGAVSALATASTGTAITSLGGAAATNATLAWLGGGSLATGGGGMAAGATVLTGITAGATAGIGLIAAGLIASTYYSKTLTEAKEYQKEVESRVADMEKLWVLMEGINKRTHELKSVTSQLEQRLLNQLEFLEPLSIDFDNTNRYYAGVFQKVATLATSMSELAQTPLLDINGNASDQSAQIIEQTYKILNKELVNHG